MTAVHPRAGHDDDPSGAGQPAGLAAGEELKRFAYVHLAPSLDQMADLSAGARRGFCPMSRSWSSASPPAQDPSRAPDGKHVLWLQVRMAPGTIKGDAARARSPRPTGRQRPTPLPNARWTFLTATPPAPAPGSLAAASSPRRAGGRQPQPRRRRSGLRQPPSGPELPVPPGTRPCRWIDPAENLHLTGAAVWPGAGTGAGPGYLLARKLAGKLTDTTMKRDTSTEQETP
jgi:phytoene dehydrogenase-like protein